MPYRRNPENKKCIQVQKSGTWETLKCHETEKQALKHLAALQINVMGKGKHK